MVCRLLSIKFCDYYVLLEIYPALLFLLQSSAAYVLFYSAIWDWRFLIFIWASIKGITPVSWHHVLQPDGCSSVWCLCMNSVPFSIWVYLLVLLSIWIPLHFFQRSCLLADKLSLLTSKVQSSSGNMGHLYGTLETEQHYCNDRSYFWCNIDFCVSCGKVVFTALLPIIHSNFIFSKLLIILCFNVYSPGISG